MAVTGVVINDIVAGDHYPIRRTVTNIPAGQTLSKAWFTSKTNVNDLDTASVAQKVVTPTFVSGQGQITDTGADGIASIVFDLQPADTRAIQAATGTVTFDIQMLLSGGTINTIEIGTVSAIDEVTLSSS